MSRRAWVALVVVVLAVLMLPGGAMLALVIKRISEDQRKVRLAFRAAARRWKWSEQLADALTLHESRWRALAVNNTGGDKKRGGAYGASQMTEQTLRSAGADDATLARIKAGDLTTQAEWTMRLLSSRPGGFPSSVEDLSAWWNAGRTTWAAVPELGKDGKPHRTRVEYLPRIQAALAFVQQNPPAGGAA